MRNYSDRPWLLVHDKNTGCFTAVLVGIAALVERFKAAAQEKPNGKGVPHDWTDIEIRMHGAHSPIFS
jgi:hypothetical protein